MVEAREAIIMPLFQHTAARRRLTRINFNCSLFAIVSTHSRAKAADIDSYRIEIQYSSFNTQPREGG